MGWHKRTNRDPKSRVVLLVPPVISSALCVCVLQCNANTRVVIHHTNIQMNSKFRAQCTLHSITVIDTSVVHTELQHTYIYMYYMYARCARQSGWTGGGWVLVGGWVPVKYSAICIYMYIYFIHQTCGGVECYLPGEFAASLECASGIALLLTIGPSGDSEIVPLNAIIVY